MHISSTARRAAPVLVIALALAASLLVSPSPARASGNLLPDDKATFATSTGGWAATGAAVSRVASPYKSGTGALRSAAAVSGNVGLYSGTSMASYAPAEAGGTYAGDAWVAASKTVRTVQPILTFYDASGAAIAYALGSGNVDGRMKYVRTPTVTGVAPSGTRYASLGLIIYGVAAREEHYVDAARLEQTAAPVVASPAAPLLGFFDKPFGESGDAARLDAAEQWQGRKNAVLGVYTNFDSNNIDRVFSQMVQIWSRGSVPMVSWMPWIGNTRGTDYNGQIANGAYDSYVRTWAEHMKAFLAGPDAVYGNADDRRAYLRFAHEANGDWYPYAPAYGGTPASSFVAMWQHVHDVVVSAGINDATRLAWVFSVNNTDGVVRMESLYPGDAYVDWLGIDGYNWGTSGGHQWETPAQVFDPMLTRLRSISTRPVGVNEVASTTDGATVAQKVQWITEYFAWVKASDIRMTMWFNDYPDMWEVFGGSYGDEVASSYPAYSTYRSAVQDPVFVSPDPGNARLLTDTKFTGR